MKLRLSYISVVRVTDTEELVSHFPMKDGEGSQIYNTQRDVFSLSSIFETECLQ